MGSLACLVLQGFWLWGDISDGDCSEYIPGMAGACRIDTYSRDLILRMSEMSTYIEFEAEYGEKLEIE